MPQAHNDNVAQPKTDLYNLKGTVSSISLRRSATGTRYAHLRFTTTMRQRQVTMTAMVWGKALDAVEASLSEGATVRLNGRFNRGDKGQTFDVVGLGREPKQAAAA